jgi:hypothetical protein
VPGADAALSPCVPFPICFCVWLWALLRSEYRAGRDGARGGGRNGPPFNGPPGHGGGPGNAPGPAGGGLNAMAQKMIAAMAAGAGGPPRHGGAPLPPNAPGGQMAGPFRLDGCSASLPYIPTLWTSVLLCWRATLQPCSALPRALRGHALRGPGPVPCTRAAKCVVSKRSTRGGSI